MSRFTTSLLLTGILFTLMPGSAEAHEPLWGESPQTFAFGVLHPEIRFGWENDSTLLRGSSRLANVSALRRTRFDAVPSLQFAPRPTLNIKVDLPFAAVATQELVGGKLRSSETGGLGNITLSMKNRFYQQITENWKTQQSYTLGITLPTGLHNGRAPTGALLSPSDQPGSGQWGGMLGYAFDYERLRDTAYFSANYRRDVTGSFRIGDQLSLDAAYGRWFRIARRTGETGVFAVIGPHLELFGHDHQVQGSDPDSGHTLLGVQGSLIVIKGQTQYRAGILFPVYRRYNGSQVAPDIQFRAGFEILL